MEFTDVIKTSFINRRLKWRPIDLGETHIGGGVYRMKDKNDQIIYVGKSHDLHRRILQHIGKDTNTKYFIDEVRVIEWMPEPSPIFQTLLEGIFIAMYSPKYNDEVKDEGKMTGYDIR
jgi:excinuclease UvrABC nuclease subunit